MTWDSPKPRLCHMVKSESGYGFHLHSEKNRPGQYIRQVESGSPAESAGLLARDRLVLVNGYNVENESHQEVVRRIKEQEKEIVLLVVDSDTDDCLKRLGLECKEEYVRTGIPGAQVAQVTRLDDSAIGEDLSVSASAFYDKVSEKDSSVEQPEPTTPSDTSSLGKVSEDVSSDLRPRLCRIVKCPQGYGFNLHSEKSKPGQFVRMVDEGLPAEQAGLRPGDRIVEVNGVNIEEKKHGEVVQMIKTGGNETTLLVVDAKTDNAFNKLKMTPTTLHLKDSLPQPFSNGAEAIEANGDMSEYNEFYSPSSQSVRSAPPIYEKARTKPNTGSMKDPFADMGLERSLTVAAAKEKAQAKRGKNRAPVMDWNTKYNLFSNL
uniref:Na(+)/H(+) exchange regulatory cofactor NHE-RF2-like n=1 Tax=Myxine glutinosa TaxID=7769 RepID=UPI00358FF7CB